MELKLGHQQTLFARQRLLIVPYGIETTSYKVKVNCHRLLIVPYGIETA